MGFTEEIVKLLNVVVGAQVLIHQRGSWHSSAVLEEIRRVSREESGSRSTLKLGASYQQD